MVATHDWRPYDNKRARYDNLILFVNLTRQIADIVSSCLSNFFGRHNFFWNNSQFENRARKDPSLFREKFLYERSKKSKRFYLAVWRSVFQPYDITYWMPTHSSGDTFYRFCRFLSDIIIWFYWAPMTTATFATPTLCTYFLTLS